MHGGRLLCQAVSEGIPLPPLAHLPLLCLFKRQVAFDFEHEADGLEGEISPYAAKRPVVFNGCASPGRLKIRDNGRTVGDDFNMIVFTSMRCREMACCVFGKVA
jgi:hypothetical protein